MVRDTKDLNPDQAVVAAKEHLRQAMEQAGHELNKGFDRTQDKIIETVTTLQHRVEESANHLSQTAHETLDSVQQRVSKSAQKPLDMIQQRPLEAVFVASLAGLVLGMLNRPKPNRREHKPGAANQESNVGQQSQSSSQASSLFSGVVVAGLGKIIWDAVQQEYLTPQKLRSWIRGFNRKPKKPNQ